MLITEILKTTQKLLYGNNATIVLQKYARNLKKYFLTTQIKRGA
jgi:hypothetical protein